jgi:hypothetical protein
MSMIGNYRRVTSLELAALQQAPSGITRFLYPDDYESIPADRHLDLDKTWHAIHFLLTGDSWEGEQPLRNAVLGGTPLGTTDVGYGPARFLTPTEVHAVAAALRTISIADIEAQFDLSKLATADIYPASWEDAEEELEYIRPYYRDLVNFFQRAAEADDAILLYIN